MPVVETCYGGPPEPSGGARAIRNPRLGERVPGSVLLRHQLDCAEAPRLKWPPRTARKVPETGPEGSICTPALSEPLQSETHSAAFPYMS